jgi:prepilin-type N-terminal cleavage/methylation domain-containing protein
MGFELRFQRPPSGGRRAGFSLIELTVVLGLLAVLAAITFPVFAAQKRSHELSTCALNLKIIGDGLRMYWEDWLGFPPDSTEDVGKDYAGHDIKGPGLFYLYYLYRNPEAGKEPGQVRWWTSVRADYGVRNLGVLHCPANLVDEPVVRRPDQGPPDPTLGGYNSYDYYYRRSWLAVWPDQGRRGLSLDFPADETVVTWCPLHRALPAPTPDPTTGLPRAGKVYPNDQDLVLWVDGAVERVNVGPASDIQWDPDFARTHGLSPPPRAQDTRDFKAEHIF